MQDLLLEIDERGIATVTLNRPDFHNAFNDGLIVQLHNTFADLRDQDHVRAIILTGAGKGFSAGADLNWMKKAAEYSEDENLADASRLSDMLHTINSVPKPVIGLVNGAAFGGGVGLAAVCDMVVASERAKFCLSEVRLGLTPATISPFVIAKIGETNARRYFLTAERFDAATAKSIGLVHEVSEDPLAQVEAWCNTLLEGAPGAIADAKALALDYANADIDDELRANSATRIAARRCSGEGREGIAAFLGKRRPAWSDDNAE